MTSTGLGPRLLAGPALPVCACLALASWLVAPLASAQQPPPAAAAAAEPPEAQAPTLNSTEQGRTAMSDSFRSRREKLHEQRLKALRATEFIGELRTYDLDRVNSNDSKSAAWAVGGSAGFQTGEFGDHVSVGAVGYTSQPLYGPSNEGGTKLLTQNQGGYTVLGEAYGQIRVTDDLGASVGLRGADTPYINRNDTRMVPQTFEAATLLGTAGPDDDHEFRYGAGYFDKEKQVDSNEFVNMAQVAGAKVDRGVYVAGFNYKENAWSLGGVEYYSPDIINIGYLEGRYTFPVGERRTINLDAQYSSQRSVGEELLTGHHFSTSQSGLKAELSAEPVLLTAGYTFTGRGSAMRNPWSSYPGYTSVQIEDFYSAGENALMLRAACSIKELPGLSAYALWVQGKTPSPGTITQNEYDANLQWIPPTGTLHGLMFRVRYGYVTQTNTGHTSELRLMLFYTFPHAK